MQVLSVIGDNDQIYDQIWTKGEEVVCMIKGRGRGRESESMREESRDTL
jgi:hypothetical protein